MSEVEFNNVTFASCLNCNSDFIIQESKFDYFVCSEKCSGEFTKQCQYEIDQQEIEQIAYMRSIQAGGLRNE